MLITLQLFAYLGSVGALCPPNCSSSETSKGLALLASVSNAFYSILHHRRIATLALPISISPVHLCIPIILILLRVAYTQAKRITASRSQKMNFVVKWGRERLHFSLPPPDTKLSVIRRQLADYTQLPEHSFKLIHAGAVMKDDNAPISAYGIKENSTIALIGGGEPLTGPQIPASKASERRTEEGTISQIRTELDKVRRTLQPDVDSFLSTLHPPSHEPTATSTAHPPQSARPAAPRRSAQSSEERDLDREHARLGELLLQSLLRLDAIIAEGEWEEARKERKGAVKEVQALLDKLDGGWRARVKI